MGWLSTLGPKGVLGPALGLVYSCKDRAATAGIGLYMLTDMQNNGTLGGGPTAATGFSYFYPAPCAHSQPAKAFGVLRTWLSFDAPI